MRLTKAVNKEERSQLYLLLFCGVFCEEFVRVGEERIDDIDVMLRKDYLY